MNVAIFIITIIYSIWTINFLGKKKRKKDMIYFVLLSLLVVIYLPDIFLDYKLPTIETLHRLVYQPVSDMILKEILQIKM